MDAGRHKVSLRLNRRSSPPAVGPVHTSGLSTRLAAAGDLVARHAPILYGRDLPEIAGRWENARTDVPMLAYHASTPGTDGTRTIEYTVIWSNEDGGTNSPALMARWGRTTDIEWIYRVRVDAAGNALDAVYHGPNHEVLPFTGAKENDHPLLQTATSNNNLLQVDDPALSSGYRFFLDTAGTLPAGRTREAAMDAEPWTYQVMAKEMLREGRLEATPDPATPEVSDQRNYLYLELDTVRARRPASAPRSRPKVGDRWYTSHHDTASWSIDRDGPAATTIELPPGTDAARRRGDQGHRHPDRGHAAAELADRGEGADARLPARRRLPAAAVVPAVARQPAADGGGARGDSVGCGRHPLGRLSDMAAELDHRRHVQHPCVHASDREGTAPPARSSAARRHVRVVICEGSTTFGGLRLEPFRFFCRAPLAKAGAPA